MAEKALRLVGDGDEGDGKDDGYDPFALDTKAYHVDKFYTKSTDGKGNGENKFIKLPPSIIGAIGELVASRVIPEYRTDQDFLRDAIVHRLHHIAQMRAEGKLEGLVNRMVMLNENQRVQQEMEECQAIVAGHEEGMAQAVRLGDRFMLEAIIQTAEYNMDMLRPNYAESLRKTVRDYKEELRRMKGREREKD